MAKGIAAHGVPQRLLTDNEAALNPSRRGATGQLVTYVTSLGVEPITGKPYEPTTQGKNERFHQTRFRFRFRFLDKQPLAETLEQLQEQIDRFDQIYNAERPHQGLPGRITPLRSKQGVFVCLFVLGEWANERFRSNLESRCVPRMRMFRVLRNGPICGTPGAPRASANLRTRAGRGGRP